MDLVKKESKAATEYFERGAYSVLNAAFTTAAVVDGITQYRLADGKALLSSSHVMTNGDLGVNVLTDSAPISPASIDDLKVLLATTKGENGEIIGYDGPLVLVVPASLESQAKVIVGSMQLPGTNFNDINTNTGIEVVVGKYLTSSTAYFLVAKDSNQMNTFVRQEPSIEFDENAGRRTIETSIESWAAFGYSDWRGVAGSRGDSVPYAG